MKTRQHHVFTLRVLKCAFSPDVLVWLAETFVKISQIPPVQFNQPHEWTLIESQKVKNNQNACVRRLNVKVRFSALKQLNIYYLADVNTVKQEQKSKICIY